MWSLCSAFVDIPFDLTTRQDIKMNHSLSIGASIHATCEAIVMAKLVDKIISQPTTETTDLLEQQLA